MYPCCRLTYVGHKPNALADLARRFDRGRFVIDAVEPQRFAAQLAAQRSNGRLADARPPLTQSPNDEWYRILLLDTAADPTATLQLLVQRRRCAGGVPVIVFANSSDDVPVLLSRFRAHGADAFVVEPLAADNTLKEIVIDSAQRLNLWRETFAVLRARMAS